MKWQTYQRNCAPRTSNYSLCRSTSRILICVTGLLLTERALAVDPDEVAPFHEPQAEHCDQRELLAIPDPHERFEAAFECGDELFETRFNMLDGVGANVGDNLRFTRVPRADKQDPGEWHTHIPVRATGPNAEACTVCHFEPFEDGSGIAGLNVVRDPLHSADIGKFIQRNAPHLFGAGALQRLAEEMSEEIKQLISQGREHSCSKRGSPVPVSLETKNVSFGTASIGCDPAKDDLSGIEGIDKNDLLVKPFQWKGSDKSLRVFNRGAGNNELGMQAVEIVGYDTDGDSDGISNELTIGDITALSVYIAAQPRPATMIELNRYGLLDLSREEIRNIRRGRVVFHQIGCAGCHLPEMIIDRPVFTEPSQIAEYRDDPEFPGGQGPIAEGVDPADPVSFDLTADQPDNVITVRGRTIHFGTFEKTESGGAIVRLYGDLKRHEMGDRLAENIDEVGTGASVWITKELWGVGSTAPYLHDGRATTLTEAILEHGGEAQSARDKAAEISEANYASMIAFLQNLILFKVEEGEVVILGDRPRLHSRRGNDRPRPRP